MLIARSRVNYYSIGVIAVSVCVIAFAAFRSSDIIFRWAKYIHSHTDRPTSLNKTKNMNVFIGYYSEMSVGRSSTCLVFRGPGGS